MSVTYSLSTNTVTACTNTQVLTFTVNPTPVVGINPSSSAICIGNSATLTANESTGEIGDTSITSLALTAGTVIYGRFVDLQVASGKVIAYKG
jgi:hypothetical protein